MHKTDTEESPRNGIFKKPSRIPAKFYNGSRPATPTPENRKCINPIIKTQLSFLEKKKLQDANTKLNDLSKSVLQIEGKLNNYTSQQNHNIVLMRAPTSAEQFVGDLFSPKQMQQLEATLRKHHDSGILMCENFLKLNQQLQDGHKLLVNNHTSKPTLIFRFILRFLRFKVPAWRKKLDAAVSEMMEILRAMQSDQKNYVCEFLTQMKQLKVGDLEEYRARQHSVIVENLTNELNSLTSQLTTLKENEISITASTDDDKKKDKVIAELNDHFKRIADYSELREQLKLAQEQLQSSSAKLNQLQEQSVKLEILHSEESSELLQSLNHEKNQRHLLQLELNQFKEQINEMQNCGDHSAAGNIFNESLQTQAIIETLCNEKNCLIDEVNRLQISAVSQKALYNQLQAQLQEKEIFLDCSEDKIRDLEQQHAEIQKKFAEAEHIHNKEISILNLAAAKSDLDLQQVNAEMMVMHNRLSEMPNTDNKVLKQLLNIRCNLIDDLQGEQDLLRNQQIVQRVEIAAREEELQDISSTLEAKDLELIQLKKLISKLKIDRQNDKRVAADLQAKMIQKSTENALLKRHFDEIINSHKMF